MKLDASMREERSNAPPLRSKSTVRSKFRALGSMENACLRASVSTEKIVERSSELTRPLESPKGSPVSTLVVGSAICC